MHFNYYFLKSLVKSLGPCLLGKRMTSCFSQNKDELILIFDDDSGKFVIKATFSNDISFLTFPPDFKRARKNSMDLFPEIRQHQILKIIQHENERSFSVVFDSDFTLLFKLHGRRANICLFKTGAFHSMFKNSFQNDHNILLNQLDRKIDQSEEAILASSFNIKEIYPTFDRQILYHLYQNDFEVRNPKEKLALIKTLLNELNSQNFYIGNKKKSPPYLSLLKDSENVVALQSSDPIEACNLLSTQYFRVYLLKKEKDNILSRIEKEICKSESYIRKTKHKLDSITEGVKNDEIANILMANLHIKPNSNNAIELYDFYRDQDITIKIKPRLSLQANAQVFYRKSKNQQIEINKLKENIAGKEQRVIELKDSKKSISNALTLKELRKTINKESTVGPNPKSQQSKPFFENNIDGYQVLIGKSAKGNDQLLQQYTSKEDLWLHARNVSGSHVVIKNSPTHISLLTIEKVAQLAAWYSKGKNDTLCPVIYTKRKYVNKPKGAVPGKVVVQREEVILVNPCQSPQ